jgi:hypothetical protein
VGENAQIHECANIVGEKDIPIGSNVRIDAITVEAVPRAVILTVGGRPDYRHRRLKTLSHRLHHIDFEPDLRALFTLCDRYLNPPRQGGGMSALLALVEHVPILTLPNCDVAGFVGNADSLPISTASPTARSSWVSMPRHGARPARRRGRSGINRRLSMTPYGPGLGRAASPSTVRYQRDGRGRSEGL